MYAYILADLRGQRSEVYRLTTKHSDRLKSWQVSTPHFLH